MKSILLLITVLFFAVGCTPTVKVEAPDKPIEITQRIVLNFYTAKRLLHALHLSVKNHEQVFGELEIDVQKRVQPQNNSNS